MLQVKKVQLESRVTAARNISARSQVAFATSSETTRRILTERFANTANLASFRQSQQERINAVNQSYIQSTQSVLDDKTLDFLVQHSNIDVPTFTSIFAGFELARASRAEREALRRDGVVANLNAETEIESQRATVRDANLQSEEQLNQAQLQFTNQQLASELSATSADVADRNNVAIQANRQQFNIDRDAEQARIASEQDTINNASRERVAQIKARNSGGNAGGTPNIDFFGRTVGNSIVTSQSSEPDFIGQSISAQQPVVENNVPQTQPQVTQNTDALNPLSSEARLTNAINQSGLTEPVPVQPLSQTESRLRDALVDQNDVPIFNQQQVDEAVNAETDSNNERIQTLEQQRLESEARLAELNAQIEELEPSDDSQEASDDPTALLDIDVTPEVDNAEPIAPTPAVENDQQVSSVLIGQAFPTGRLSSESLLSEAQQLNDIIGNTESSEADIQAANARLDEFNVDGVVSGLDSGQLILHTNVETGQQIILFNGQESPEGFVVGGAI